MNKNLHKLAKSVVSLQKEAVRQTLLVYKPKVDKIINSQSKDNKVIECTLDALCEVAFDNEVLVIFKKPCRYYHTIDPLATAQQIYFYKDMWDNERETLIE